VEHSRSLAIILSVRWALAVLLAVVATVCAYASVLAYWVDTVLLDTPAFMEAIGPIVNDDSARAQASTTISTTVMDVIDIRQVTDLVAPGRDVPLIAHLATDLGPPVRENVQPAVGTDTFAALWLGAIPPWPVGLVAPVPANANDSVTDRSAKPLPHGP